MPLRRRTRRRRPRHGLRTAVLVLVLISALSLLSQNALANTYVITDGNEVKTHITFASDPAAVLDEAGVALDEDDTYTTALEDGIYEITVRRSHKVTVDHCGEIIRTESVDETVAQLLARLGISVDGDTRISHDPKQQILEDQLITVDRVVRVTETYTAVIPFETTYYEDPSLPAGVEAVLVQGQEGQMRCTAAVVYEEGRELSRTVLSQTVVRQPVNSVVAVGTGAPQDTESQSGLIIGDGIIITPDGQVLTYTGTMDVLATAYTHTDEGCDFITATGTTVRVGTVAVDPRLIPYGTRMFIITKDGAYIYGISTAEDCGSAIKNYRVDLYFPTDAECWEFGRRDATIYFLG
jgi:3D (Asp-Asp-Asp) domain-containing protein